jgi:DNA-binding NarL/FixJ family response regulator
MPRITRRKRILWTTDELKILKKLAGKEGVRKIARQLKRSEAAVRFKAWQMRVKLAVRKTARKV